MPEVSVIIPVYNRPELLREAVASVLAQTFTDYELIIVDDGSTDETSSVAAGFASDRCLVITSPHAGFPGAARNRGAEAAAGRYLSFLDSDDYWLPEKLERQHALMIGSGYLFSHTLEKWQRGEKIVSQKSQKHRREGNLFYDALKKCIMGPSTSMIDRNFYLETGGFHEMLEIAEDYEYWLRITSQTSVAYLNEALTVKRAGDWPQLSEKYGKIEWFRLCALAGLLGIDMPGMLPPAADSCYVSGYSWPGFPDDCRSAAVDEFIFKCSVWSAGCRKRGRISEVGQIDAIIEMINN